MTSTSTLVSRFKFALLGQVIVAASGVVVTVVLARILSPNDYGLLFLATSILSTFITFSKLGIAQSSARYISEYKETDPRQLPHIIRSSFWMISVTITLTCTVLYLSHEYIAERVGEPDLNPLLLLGVLYVMFMTLEVFFRYTLQGLEEIKNSILIKVITQSGSAIFAVGFVLLGYGAAGALSGYIVAFVIATITGAALVYHNVDVSATRSMERGLRRRIAEYSLPITATSTMANLDNEIDSILIGFFLSPVAVGFYTISKQVVTFIEKPMSAAGFTLSPTFGAEKAKQNVDRAREIYENTLLAALILYIPAAAGLVLVARPVIELVFGSEYLGAVPVLQVLCAFAVFNAVMKITSHSLDYLGRARTRAIVRGVTAVCNLLLNLILIPTIGVVGAAIATVITYGIYTSVSVYIIYNEFNLRIRHIFNQLVYILVVTGEMSIVVVYLLEYVTGWISLFFVVGIGFLFWFGGSVVTGLIEPRRTLSVLSS